MDAVVVIVGWTVRALPDEGAFGPRANGVKGSDANSFLAPAGSILDLAASRRLVAPDEAQRFMGMDAGAA